MTERQNEERSHGTEKRGTRGQRNTVRRSSLSYASAFSFLPFRPLQGNAFEVFCVLFRVFAFTQFFSFVNNFSPSFPKRDAIVAKQFNKLTAVFHASVLFLIMNFVMTLSKWQNTLTML